MYADLNDDGNITADDREQLLGYLPFSVQTVQAASAMTLKTIKNGTDVTTIDPTFDPRQDSIITFKWNKKNGFKTVNIR